VFANVPLDALCGGAGVVDAGPATVRFHDDGRPGREPILPIDSAAAVVEVGETPRTELGDPDQDVGGEAGFEIGPIEGGQVSPETHSALERFGIVDAERLQFLRQPRFEAWEADGEEVEFVGIGGRSGGRHHVVAIS